MTIENANKLLGKLPEEKRNLAFSFIQFLADETPAKPPRAKTKRLALDKHPAIGIWKDIPKDISSAEWLKELREREWKRHV